MPEHKNVLYFESDGARKASEYYNSLPFEERAMLAPLLDHYRQMGLAEAADHMRDGLAKVTSRVNEIKRTQPDLMAALAVSLTAIKAEDTAPGSHPTPEEGR